MFNTSEIMRDAWSKYRSIRQRYGAWQIERGIVDASFSACLKMAWAAAKNAANAVAHKVKMDKVLAGPKGPTLQALLSALENVQYTTLRTNARNQRAAIQARIDALVSEEA